MKIKLANILVATVLLPLLFLGQRADSYTLNWSTLDGGGGPSSGGAYTLNGTAGQPDASASSIGGNFSLVGGFWPGAASVVQTERPRLEITLAGAVVILSWPAQATDFSLQEATDLMDRNWSVVTTPPVVFPGVNVVVLPATSPQRYFRLIKP